MLDYLSSGILLVDLGGVSMVVDLGGGGGILVVVVESWSCITVVESRWWWWNLSRVSRWWILAVDGSLAWWDLNIFVVFSFVVFLDTFVLRHFCRYSPKTK